MPNFYEYNPEQAYLLPPSVRQVLGEEHLCFFVHRAVEKLDLRGFEQGYGDEGHPAYHPALLLTVWLYSYALGMGHLGHVAIDSTRIAANAAADSTDTIEKLRAERAKIRKRIRRWQQQCEAADPNEGAGTTVTRAALEKLQQQLTKIPVRMERLKKAGVKRLSRSDEDSRFLRDRQGFTLGYTVTLAVSADHLILARSRSVKSPRTMRCWCRW